MGGDFQSHVMSCCLERFWKVCASPPFRRLSKVEDTPGSEQGPEDVVESRQDDDGPPKVRKGVRVIVKTSEADVKEMFTKSKGQCCCFTGAAHVFCLLAKPPMYSSIDGSR